MRLIYLFDTSGINRLHDDPYRDAIQTGLVATNNVWVSALNVAEAAQTSEGTRRNSLLRLLKALTCGYRPLEIPPVLIKRGIEAYSKGLPSIDISVGTDIDVFWEVLLEPTLLNKKIPNELVQPLREIEKRFLETHRSARPHVQDFFAKDKPPPSSAAAFLRAFASNEKFLHDIVNPIYVDVVGDELPALETMHLLMALPQLTGFLLSYGHSIYCRAVARSGYGTNNAGNVDIWFAAYLSQVDMFVTNDMKQYQALRLVARIFAPRCQVLVYDSFRRRMVLETGA